MKLLGGNAVDFKGWDSTYGPPWSYGSFASPCYPQEPIRVQVRVRPYTDALADPLQVCKGGLNPARLPVGTLLDCYI